MKSKSVLVMHGDMFEMDAVEKHEAKKEKCRKKRERENRGQDWGHKRKRRN